MKMSSTSNTMSSRSGRKCIRCGKNSILFDESNNEKFCSYCGYVISENAEQETFSEELSNKSSITSDIGSATINPKDKDAFGKPVSESMAGSIKRTSKLDSRAKTHSSTEKNLKQAQSEIDKLKDKLVLSDAVIQKAKSIYKKAIKKKLTTGYSIEGMVGACIYASCKDMEIPRTMKDVSDSIGGKKNNVSRCYKVIVKELDLRTPVTDPIQHVSRIASKLEFTEKTKRKAISILKEAKKSGINVGKEPMGIIAGVLYLAGLRVEEEPKSQKEIAEASGVTEVTIRKRCKDIVEIIDW